MKKKDLKELKTKSLADLRKKLSELEKEKVKSLIELKMGKLKNVHIVRELRRDIAQTKTIMKMKYLASKLVSLKKEKEIKNAAN